MANVIIIGEGLKADRVQFGLELRGHSQVRQPDNELELGPNDVVLALWGATDLDYGLHDLAMEAGKQRKLLCASLERDVRPPLGFGQVHAIDLSAWDGMPYAKPFEQIGDGD